MSAMKAERFPRRRTILNTHLPLVRLARRWIVGGALGRDTRGKTGRALDKAAQLDLATLAALASVGIRSRA
jgi:hypothetical protein